MKHFLLFLSIFLLTTVHSRASHLAGGQLTYEQSGSNYIFTLVLYRDCAGIPLPNSATLSVSSASQSSNFTISMLQSTQYTVSVPCPGGTNKCYNPTSNIPGYNVGVYKAILTLPAAASDWVFSHDASARTSTNNLTGTPNLHLSATLNNLNGGNTNTYIPNIPPFYITPNAVTIPLQAVDADGDSIVIERIAPKTSATTNATYSAGGYSATTPFGAGSTYTINQTAQTMTLQGSTIGQFNLAFLVKEYRNGVLIGSYIRDFLTSILPGSVNYSIPMLNNPSAAIAYACPGSTGITTLSFTDPSANDSVYISVNTPTLSGWTFNVNSTPGIPTANTVISWTAPNNLNPATLPYFYIDISVWDNACPRGVANYVMLVRTQQCPTDSVWPGDANSDKVVNIWDALAIAVAYNQTGPTRPNASTNWVPQWSQDWANNYPFTTVNVKHGDCNGNGVINAGDLVAVATNYSLTHPKGGARSKTTGDPDLYFDMTGITLAPGKTVAIPIKLGTSADPMKDFYGVGTNIQISGVTLTSQATVTTTNSWLGNSTNTMEFSKNFSKSNLDWAFARNDQQNMTGNGTLATLNFTVPSGATPGTTINFDFGNTVMTDKDGTPITAFNPINASATIVPDNISNTNTLLTEVNVIPNPSGNEAHLQMKVASAVNIGVRIADVTGKTVYSSNEHLSSGNNHINLPATGLTSGVYTIHITTDDQKESNTLKWVKQ